MGRLTLTLLIAVVASTAVAGDLEDARTFARHGEANPVFYEYAAHLYRRAAEAAPDDPAPWVGLAELGLTTGDVDLAVDASGRVRRLDAENAEAWALAARCAAAAGLAFTEARRSSTDIRLMYDDAARLARRAIELDPKVRTAHRVLADAALSVLDDPDATTNAITYLRSEVSVSPDDADSWWKLGELLFRDARDYTGAVDALRGCVKADPQRAVAWRWLGTALEYARDPKAAADAYLAALRLVPTDAYAFDRLWRCGVTRTASGLNYEDALANVAKSATLDGEPTAETLQFHRIHAWLLSQARRHEAAVAELRELAESFPDDPATDAYLGKALLDAGKSDEGVAILRRLVEANPEPGYPFAVLARHGFESGDLALMEWLFEQSPNADLANNIGFFHRDRTRDYEASLKWYLKASELAPENPDVLNDTGLIYQYHLNDFDRAIVFYDKAIEAAKRNLPDDIADAASFDAALRAGKPVRGYGDAQENLATIFIARKQWAKARERLAIILALQPRRPQSLRLLGIVEANE